MSLCAGTVPNNRAEKELPGRGGEVYAVDEGYSVMISLFCKTKDGGTQDREWVKHTV